MSGSHRTIIADEVVDAVSAQCGMAAAGLYLMLERRVGKDGSWVTTTGQLAGWFNQTDRHVREAAAALERAGFLLRDVVSGPNGMSIGVRFTLPKHLRTYRAEPTPEVTPEPTPEPHARGFGVSSYEVVTSSSTAGRATRLPTDYPLSDEMREWSAKETPGLDVEFHHKQFCRYWWSESGKHATKINWFLTWQKWMAKEFKDHPPRSRPASNGHYGKPSRGMTTEEILAYGNGEFHAQERDGESVIDAAGRVVERRDHPGEDRGLSLGHR